MAVKIVLCVVSADIFLRVDAIYTILILPLLYIILADWVNFPILYAVAM